VRMFDMPHFTSLPPRYMVRSSLGLNLVRLGLVQVGTDTGLQQNGYSRADAVADGAQYAVRRILPRHRRFNSRRGGYSIPACL
jgi:hypothetical protein